MALLFISCGVDRVYTSATYGSIRPHTEKPVMEGESEKGITKSYTYISGNMSDGKNHQEDTDFITSFDVYRSYAQKNANYYFGGGASFGTYRFGLPYLDLITNGEKHSFGSLNFRVGSNMALHSRFIDFRLIGLEILYNYEFGSYQKKISKIPKEDNVVVLPQKSMLSYNLYTEYVIKISAKNCLTFGLYAGGLPLVNTSQNTGFHGLNLSYTYHKYTLYYVREIGNGQMESHKFGIAYRF